ncbi:hypothetical protein IKF86_01770 [Candidatus Saccharibacteria bacterium]|nr:hypothetical protein [Candidatus Saccharibacteria bacterium]
MNKDVIYIEPEDDITDIIAKIENSKEKIVALVPPKKSGVLRSIVNIKLIAKSGAAVGKTVVIVTTDPSIIKLAATTKLPVTKNLQSAPSIPEDADANEELVKVAKSDVIVAEEADDDEEIAEETEEEVEADDEEDTSDSDDNDEPEEDGEGETADEDADDNKAAKDAKKDKKNAVKGKLANSKNKVLRWIGQHKKITIACAVGLVVLIVVGIWAFVIAPAATLTIGLRTTSANFSENVTFTDKAEEEKAAEGQFYLTEKKIESKAEKEFEATGKKDIGEHASGQIAVTAYLRSGSIVVPAGTIFTYKGLAYSSAAAITLAYDGSDDSVCLNKGDTASLVKNGCMVSGRTDVVAVEPGEKYNVEKSETGWSVGLDVTAYAYTAMTGGTSNVITVVQQSDVDAIAKDIQTSSESDNKAKLYDTIDKDTNIIIDSSFKQHIGDVISTPAVGEEVKEGVKPKVSITTTDTVFIIDKTKVEEFISEKAKLADNFKIYTMNDPFVENFVKAETGYTGKLKTSYTSGPKVTENEIVEIVKGKGLGVAQHDLKDIDGIGTIKIDTSFPWVMSIPNNPDKITVNLEVAE